MISKKQYKVIYKLREKYGERKLKDILFYKYGINITLNKLKHIIENIPYSRDKYSEIDKKRILYLYSNYVNTSKLVSYLNKKYKYDLTERRIIDYASRNNVKKKFQNMYSQAFITRNQEYEIAKQYLPFIVRGIIDGDGWIRKDGGEFFICSASEKFIKWCKEALEELKFVNIKIRFIANDFNGIYIIRSAVIHNINLLQNLIYKQPFGMMRKYNLLHKKDVQRL